MSKKNNKWVLWTSELSPYGLKVELLCHQAKLAFELHPQQANFCSGHRSRRRVDALRNHKQPISWPLQNELHELPLVPYLLGPEGKNLVDSSAIGYWLQQQQPKLQLAPAPDTALGFAISLIDEALDEFGLYMVHHNRWAVSAHDNNAGERLANEMGSILGPFKRFIAKQFPKRQTRRLPYLFSVAEDSRYSHGHQLPAPKGFPATQDLLDQAFNELLLAVESVYDKQPYLFGESMTLADASVLGQLGMNRFDRSGWEIIERTAPTTAQVIDAHYRKPPPQPATQNPLILSENLAPLLKWCCDYFVPLMQQNCGAYSSHRELGETVFNESAFDKGRALYDGTLQGKRFRSVAKTFQVDVWNNLHHHWKNLSEKDKQQVSVLLPDYADLSKQIAPVELINPNSI